MFTRTGPRTGPLMVPRSLSVPVLDRSFSGLMHPYFIRVNQKLIFLVTIRVKSVKRIHSPSSLIVHGTYYKIALFDWLSTYCGIKKNFGFCNFLTRPDMKTIKFFLYRLIINLFYNYPLINSINSYLKFIIYVFFCFIIIFFFIFIFI